MKYNPSRAIRETVESLPSQGAWIEICVRNLSEANKLSLPSQGAWIEITFKNDKFLDLVVAPFTGSVD